MRFIRIASALSLACALALSVPFASPAQASETGHTEADASTDGRQDYEGQGGSVTTRPWRSPECGEDGSTYDPNIGKPRAMPVSPTCEKGDGGGGGKWKESTRYWEDGGYTNCLHGLEVYRFYGTKANPVEAVTMSKANLPDECHPDSKTKVRLFYPHPADSSEVDADYLEQVDSPYVEKVRVASGFDMADKMYPLDGRQVVTAPGNVPTTADPRATLGSTCDAISEGKSQQTNDRRFTVEHWFNFTRDGDDVPAEDKVYPYRLPLQQVMFKAYQDAWNSVSKTPGVSDKLKDKYARNFAFVAADPANGRLGQKITSPEGIKKLATRGKCISPFEFAAPTLKSLGKQAPVIGMCATKLVGPGGSIARWNEQRRDGVFYRGELLYEGYFTGFGGSYYGGPPQLTTTKVGKGITGRSGLFNPRQSQETSDLKDHKDAVRVMKKSAATLRAKIPLHSSLWGNKEQVGGFANPFGTANAWPSRSQIKQYGLVGSYAKYYAQATRMSNITQSLKDSLECDTMVLELYLCAPGSSDWNNETKSCDKKATVCNEDNVLWNPDTNSCGLTYNVTYDPNGGSGAVPVDDIEYEENQDVNVKDQGGVYLTGSKFLGWSTTPDNTGVLYPAPTSKAFQITSDTTLYARWQPKTAFTVTYHKGYGGQGAAPVDTLSPYASNSTVTVLGKGTALSRPGHSFTGWNLAINGSGTSYQPGQTFTITKNVTLYAQWSSAPPPPQPQGIAVQLTLSADKVFHVGGTEAEQEAYIEGLATTDSKYVVTPTGYSAPKAPELRSIESLTLSLRPVLSNGVSASGYVKCASPTSPDCSYGVLPAAAARWRGYFFSPTTSEEWMKPTAQLRAWVQEYEWKTIRVPAPCPTGSPRGRVCTKTKKIVVPKPNLTLVTNYTWVHSGNPYSPVDPRWKVIGSTGYRPASWP